MNLRTCPCLHYSGYREFGLFTPFNLQNTTGLRVLSFSILLKIEGCCCGVDGFNLSNIDDFGQQEALSPLPFAASTAMTYHESDYLSLRRLKIFTNYGDI